MPIFMDRHDVPGATAADVAHAHQKDLDIQDRYNCRAITYWFDEARGTAFCLIEAPDAQAVQAMHDSAHGLIPHLILQVESDTIEAFLGRIQDPETPAGTEPVTTEIIEPALRTILSLDTRSPSQLKMSADQASRSMAAKGRISDIVTRHGGREVEHAGNKFIASFSLLAEAITCAMEIRHFFSADSEGIAIGAVPRIGLSAGVPVTESSELFGDAVRSASLLSDHARKGEVLLAPSVYEYAGSEALGLPAGMRVLNDTEQQFLIALTEVAARVWTEPKLQNAEIAKELGLSTSQLYRQSIAVTGRAPSRFMQDYRLEKAACSIERREGTLSEIAFASGFCSLSYFSKCFKKKYGLLPSHYAAQLAHISTV
ncbi:DUF4242 domain-containing protein [bacterium]|nr:DUF4242 domain-containing protein [bacterium]